MPNPTVNSLSKPPPPKPKPPNAPSIPPPPSKSPNGTIPSSQAAKFTREIVAAPPPRIVLNAVDGFGKTTAGAYVPDGALLMTDTETGYQTLRGAGLVPEIDTAVSSTWPQTLSTIDALIAVPGNHKALVLDALGGFERQCQEYVCQTQFGGDWGEKGFGSYQKGYELSSIEFIKLLARLDMLRSRHGMMILILSHCRIRPFKNPEGPDYDRYSANVHDKVWDLVKQWSDAVLFGTFLTALSDNKDATKKKAKMLGGNERIIYTERSAAYDAKNRFGLDPEIPIPNDRALAWQTIADAIQRRNSNVAK